MGSNQRVRAIGDRIIVAQVQRTDHKKVIRDDGTEVKLWNGREKAEPLGVVLSVGPDVGCKADLRKAVRAFIDSLGGPTEDDEWDGMVKALGVQSVSPGDVVLYRRSDTVAETGGVEKWRGKFNLEVLGQDEVWAVLDAANDDEEFDAGEAGSMTAGALVKAVA